MSLKDLIVSFCHVLLLIGGMCGPNCYNISVDVVNIKLIFKRLNLISLSCKLHRGHSTEPFHHGRPTYRPGGNCGDL